MSSDSELFCLELEFPQFWFLIQKQLPHDCVGFKLGHSLRLRITESKGERKSTSLSASGNSVFENALTLGSVTLFVQNMVSNTHVSVVSVTVHLTGNCANFTPINYVHCRRNLVVHRH